MATGSKTARRVLPARSDRVSRSEQIAEIMLDRMRRQELKVGDRLPSESALATRFGVSRAAIREAIARLKAEGVVESFQGSGAFVRSPETIKDSLDAATRSSLKSLLDLIEVRRVIEAEIAARAAKYRSADQLAVIERAFDRLCVAEENNEDGVVEDCDFHASIAAASGNIYWQKLTDALARNAAIGIRVTRVNEARRRDFAVEVKAEHAALLAAVKAGDSVAASAAAVHHMERAAHRILSAEHDFWKSGGVPLHDLGR